MVRKTIFLVIIARFWKSHFYVKKEMFSMNFHKKCFKTTGRHSLAVWGSLFGEKQFLLIFVPFCWLDHKSSLNKSKFSSGFAPFKYGKKNKLSVYLVLVSEIDTFISKKKKFLWISTKMLQNNIKAQFYSMRLTLWRKTVFVNIYPFYWFDQKHFIKQI